jgi:DNA topoisomerase IB
MRLRKSVLTQPGITRRRRGRGFSYYGPDGRRLTEPADLARIDEMVIPPAWKKVWIAPYANGHIQAVGVDAAGRRQYLYHPTWQEERAEEKFDRVLEMSKALPAWRLRIATDLDARGRTRDRVMALALHLLDRGYFRAGGEQYAEENESYGLATLLCEHVSFRGNAVVFDYPAKSGVRRTLELADPQVVRAVRALLRGRSRSERLLVCRDGAKYCDIHADDLNAQFKSLVGESYSVKDLRTWHGTVLAAAAFAEAKPAASQRISRREQAAVMRQVSEALGNTPAVARASYVDPRVVTGYEQGMTIASATRKAAMGGPERAQETLEKATRNLILRIQSDRLSKSA